MKLTRRGVIGGAAAASSLGLGSILVGSTTAQTTSTISALDQSVDNPEGELDSLTISPELTVTWDGMDEEVTGIDLVVRLPEYNATLYDENHPTNGTAGQKTLSTGELDLLSVISPEQFEPTSDGGTETETVTVGYFIVFHNGSDVVMSDLSRDASFEDLRAYDEAGVIVEEVSFSVSVKDEVTATPEPTTAEELNAPPCENPGNKAGGPPEEVPGCGYGPGGKKQ